MNQPKTNSFFQPIKKTFLLSLVAFLLIFSPLGTSKALAWDALPAGEAIFAQTKIWDFIQETMLASLKQSAIQMVSNQVDRFISGVSGNGARFITNWKDYLVDSPKRTARAYANDYISQAFAGRGMSNYRSTSGLVLGASTESEGFGARVLAAVTDCSVANTGTECQMADGTIGTCQPMGGNVMECSSVNGSPAPSESYAEEMQTLADKWVINPEPKTFPNIDTENLLAGKDLSNLNLLVLENNMPSDVVMYTQAYMDKVEKEETATATAQSIAYKGFLGNVAEDGSVTKPGSLIADMKANVENLPNMAMAYAKSLPEIIAATVSKAISSLTESAVSGAQRAVDKKLNSVTDKAVNQVNSKVNAYGPGALYGN